MRALVRTRGVLGRAAPAEPTDYDDVMKLIEENRKKNEAKRAAQSARNAEIIAAFEQRQAGGGQ